MDVDLAVVRKVYSDVLSKNITRESADRWAFSVMERWASGTVAFVPASDEEEIWGAVMYLYGIDARKTPEKYLQSDQDISKEMSDRFD